MTGFPSLMMPAFSRNIGDCVPENALVIQSDGGDHAHLGVDDVGGVQTTSQTDFDNRDIHVLLAEVVERHASDALKEGERGGESLLDLVDLLQVANHLLLGNHFPVDGDSLTETGNVRRHVHTRFVTRRFQRLGNLEHDGALSIGARDMDRFDLVRGIAKLLVEKNHVLETHLHLEVQILRVEVLQQI